jgi:hypothetical protein
MVAAPLMRIVQTLLVLDLVLAKLDMKEMVKSAMILMNVKLITVDALLMLIALMFLDQEHVHAKLDLLVMVSLA